MNGGRFGLVGVLYAGYKDDVDIEWLLLDKEAYRIESDFQEDESDSGGYDVSRRQLFGLNHANAANLSTAQTLPPAPAPGMHLELLQAGVASAQHEVEEVLGTRTFQGNRECYVKWKYLSYLRAEWVSEERVKLDGKFALKKIQRRIEVDQGSHIVPWATVPARDADRRPEAVDSEYFTVERILHHRELLQSNSPEPAKASASVAELPGSATAAAATSVAPIVPNDNPSVASAAASSAADGAEPLDAPKVEYLVKWRGMNYNDCATSAMEPADAIKDDAAIEHYHMDQEKYKSNPYLSR